MQSQTYIMFFVFSCLAVVGLFLVALAGCFVAHMLLMPKPPKPTKWEKDWAEIEKDLNK